MTNNLYFHQTKNPEQVLKEIEQAFQVIREKSFNGIRRQYDSFDWRLYKNDLELINEQNHFRVVSTKNPNNHWRLGNSRRPVFANDIKDQGIREKLLPILEMRAFTLVVSTKIIRIRGGILDTNLKTILRFEIEKVISGQKELPVHFRIIPLRGFSGATAKMRAWLSASGFAQADKSVFEQVCHLSGILPGAYSSKLNIKLDGGISVNAGVHKIHKELFKTIEQNESGIINDVDTEFLHDFRVAVRRTRSLYLQARNQIDPGLFANAKRDFGYLGKLTNRMRDIDVYMLNREKYLAMLPPDLCPVMERFFTDLGRERQRELRKLRTALQSKRYRQIKSFWTELLNSEGFPDKELISVQEFARKMIFDMLRKVLKTGSKINRNSPDSLLHKLRIACKKLRYALEFYASLFPPEVITVLIRQLKLLQDNLGDFNDLVVQQAELNDYVGQLKEPVSKDLVLAIGFLIALLHRRQKSKRSQFAETYVRFAGEETQRIFNDIKSGSI